jgi:hypothetical protein
MPVFWVRADYQECLEPLLHGPPGPLPAMQPLAPLPEEHEAEAAASSFLSLTLGLK